MKFKLVETLSYDEIPDENKNGNCYQVAFNFVLNNQPSVLVHGLVHGQGPLEGIVYGHAWAEIGDVVFDKTTNTVMRKEQYYELGQIEYTKTYDYNQMLEKALKTKNYGPWDKKLLDNPY